MDALKTLEPEAKEALERNGMSLDVTALGEEHLFIKDMNETELGCAFALYQTGCIESSANLLKLSNFRIATECRKPSVQRLIAILVRSDLKTKGIKKAFDALEDVLDDSGESANARIKAAETVLKWSGEVGKEAEKAEEDELSNMSITDLERTIAKLEDKRSELSKRAEPVQSN